MSCVVAEANVFIIDITGEGFDFGANNNDDDDNIWKLLH